MKKIVFVTLLIIATAAMSVAQQQKQASQATEASNVVTAGPSADAAIGQAKETTFNLVLRHRTDLSPLGIASSNEDCGPDKGKCSGDGHCCRIGGSGWCCLLLCLHLHLLVAAPGLANRAQP